MAKFQLRLLNIRAVEQEDYVSYQIMTDFDSSIITSVGNTNYTYNEKFKITSNAQKSLSFTMDESITTQDGIENNPFVDNVTFGSQLLLIDQYNNHYLMTVNKITYDFKPYNTIYHYECQDSFTYQLSRQNRDYEIINNIEKENFIGARNIDWWVLQKLQPDCHIGYKYLKLADQGPLGSKKTVLLNNSNNQDFYRTISFEGKGTANSLLIKLGQELGLQVHVYEHLKGAKLERYYWFEPLKYLKYSGLKYSPYRDIQSFSLSHNGQALSTILNVYGKNNNQEITTLIPTVPLFFRNLFASEKWKDIEYYKGFFTTICQQEDHQIFKGQANLKEITYGTEPKNYKAAYENYQSFIKIEKVNENQNNNKIYFPIYTTSGSFKFNPLYNFISFVSNDASIIKNKENIYSSKFGNWKLLLGTDQDSILLDINNAIPNEILNKNFSYAFIVIDINESSWELLDYNINIKFYREATEEELQFAYIADNCPWLENKLISFEYFYNNKILTNQDMQKINNFLTNDLRKINGQLLLYSQLYYNAVNIKTKILGELEKQLDLLGASIQSNLIDAYNVFGKHKEVSDIIENYTALFKQNEEPVNLINYHETLRKFLTYYIEAEQGFLKNIHEFYNYFYDNIGHSELYTYTITLKEDLKDSNKEFMYSFDTPSFEKITATTQFWLPIYKDNNGTKEIFSNQLIVTKDNYKNFKVPLIKKDSFSAAKKFNKEVQYYEKKWKVGKITDQSPDKLKTKPSYENYKLYNITHTLCLENGVLSNINNCIIKNNEEKVIDDFVPFDQKNPEISWKLELTELEPFYEPVYEFNLKKNWLYRHITNSNYKNDWKYKNGFIWKDAYSNWKNIFFEYSSENYSFLKKDIMWTSPEFMNEINNIHNFTKEDALDLYTKMFPLEQISYKTAKGAELVPFVNINNANKFARRVMVSQEVKTKAWARVKKWWKERYSTQIEFDTQGWTFYSLNGDSITPFQDFYNGNEQVYCKDVLSYQKVIDNVTGTESERIQSDIWNLNCLHTYQSLTHVLNLEGSNELRKKFYYRTALLEPVKETDKIDIQADYRVLVWDEKETNFMSDKMINYLNNANNSASIDTIVYYPFNNLLLPLDLSQISTQGLTLTEVVKKITSLDTIQFNEDNHFQMTFENTARYAIIFKLRDQEFSLFQDIKDITPLTIKDYTSIQWYDGNEIPVILHDEESFAEGFYFMNEKDENFVSPNTDFDENQNYYLYINNKYERAYTYSQIKKSNTFYFLKNSTKELLSFSPLEKQKILLNKYKKDITTEQFVFIESIPKDFILSETLEHSEYTVAIKKDSLSSVNNGTFCLKYKNNSNALLREKAMLIETNLTQLWNNAYINSKNCRFFLPEHWQPAVNQAINYYSDKIISYTYNDENELIKCDLQNFFIPKVTIAKGRNYLIDYNNQESQRQILSESNNHLDIGNTTAISDILLINNSLSDIYKYLDFPQQNWIATDIGERMWYNWDRSGSGMIWNQAISWLSGNQINQELLGGWYDMMIKVLLTCNYKNDPAVLYHQALNNHNLLWDEFYKKYGYIIFEQDYTNEDAINSRKLLESAQYAFRDYNNIERNYNINIINPSVLDGYQGQELRIGDSIELAADELYDKDNEVKRSLQQHLFISDLSYTLRSDESIAITVNDIKYQDKVISQLIKLIR